MRINLCCTDRTVPKHPLDISDINILFQQKRGEGVPEHMGCDMLADTGQFSIMIDHKADGLVGQLMLESVYKEISS